jgi:hypothetical protein
MAMVAEMQRAQRAQGEELARMNRVLDRVDKYVRAG